MPLIAIINGPNLNLLGTREPHLYGSLSLNDIESGLKKAAKKWQENHKHDLVLEFFQSNHEGDLIDQIQKMGACDGIILNAGAYSHSSIGLRDAISAITAPVIEVHLSNIHAREAFRHISLIAPVAKAMIAGLGAEGYYLALTALVTPFQQEAL